MQSVGIFDPDIKRMSLRGGHASDFGRCYPLDGLKVSILLLLRIEKDYIFWFLFTCITDQLNELFQEEQNKLAFDIR